MIAATWLEARNTCTWLKIGAGAGVGAFIWLKIGTSAVRLIMK